MMYGVCTGARLIAHQRHVRWMVVIGYSRRWLFRPEVSIQIPHAALDTLSERARHLLRFNPIVESLDEKPEVEVYQS